MLRKGFVVLVLDSGSGNRQSVQLVRTQGGIP